MATKLTKKQQTQLTEKLTGIIQKNNTLQLRMSTDTSVNEMNVNQISGALNRIHGQAIGKDLPTVISIPVKQAGSGDPSPDNIRPITLYEIDGIGVFASGDINIEEMSLTILYRSADLGTLTWTVSATTGNHFTLLAGAKAFTNSQTATAYCSVYSVIRGDALASLDNSFAIMNNSNRMVVHDTAKSGIDTEAFKEAVSGYIVAYELATPETYTLTPQQMIQLLDQL